MNKPTTTFDPSHRATRGSTANGGGQSVLTCIPVIEPDFELSTRRGIDGDALSAVPNAFDAYLACQELLWG